MTTQMNLNLLDQTHPSIFIPHVFTTISELKIRQVLDEQSLGKISRINIVMNCKNKKGEVFNRVYIHFEKWYLNEEAQNMRRILISGKEIKIIYDNPWFWKVSANKWEPSPITSPITPPIKKTLIFNNDFRDERVEYDGLSLSLSDLNTDEFDYGRDLSLSDLNTDEFDYGRDLSLSDLNTTTNNFDEKLSLSDLNTTTNNFDEKLSLSDLNTTTNNLGRDLSLSDLNINNNTDEFGRDLILKRDYLARRMMVINNFINNFRPINRRFNDKRINKGINKTIKSISPSPLREPKPEQVNEEENKRVLLPFIMSILEDVDNLNIPKIDIDYGNPIPVPKKKRINIKKNNVQLPVQNISKRMNWYDDDEDSDDEDININDTDNFLTQVFNKMDINDTTDNKFRPSSPDYPPPNIQEEEEDILDIYADLDTYVESD